MADNTYKRRWGDRKEGRQLRSLPALNKVAPYIMVERNDACNYFEDKIEITEIDRFLRAKRAEGWKGMGMLHVFIAAYLRIVSQFPGVNRFIGGQRIFARNNIEVVMVIKRTLELNAPETSIKVVFDPSDTIFDVYRKLNEQIDNIKANTGDNNTEKLAGLLFKIPGVVLKFAVWFLKTLDYFGLLPKAIMDASPFHGSMIITDLGSLGIPPIYHHIYNFGTLPVFIAFGAKRREYAISADGSPVEKKYIDYTVVSDERICDGHYFAAAFKYFKHYLRKPELLEQPPEQVVEDIF